MTESFYEVLRVDPDADASAIRRAYRERIKETHPDVSDAPDADARTKRLVEAKETLLDPGERARYDRLGHEAYAGDGTEPSSQAGSDEGAGEGSTDDARSGGRTTPDAGGPTDDPGRSSTAGAAGGQTNDRVGPWERRAREAWARERVETDAAWVGDEAGGRARARAGDGTAAANGGRAVSWADSRFDVSVEPGDVADRAPWLSVGEAPATALAAWILYPVLVAGAAMPPFPLWVNAVVAACTITMVAALQAMPGVGVAVFGTWSIVGTVALAVAGISPLGVVGLLVLGATWLPFGLTLLTAWILRA